MAFGASMPIRTWFFADTQDGNGHVLANFDGFVTAAGEDQH